jgi:hypothetical protein
MEFTVEEAFETSSHLHKVEFEVHLRVKTSSARSSKMDFEVKARFRDRGAASTHLHCINIDE